MLSDDQIIKRVEELVRTNKRLTNRLNLNAVKARRSERKLKKQINLLKAMEEWEPEW